MFRVKRSKGGATHYATGFAPSGAVIGLAKEVARALAVPGEAVERVKAFYANRPKAGAIEFEPTGEPDPAPAPKGGTAEDVAKLRKKLDRAEAAYKDVAAELEKARAENAARAAARDAAARERDEYRDQVAELTKPAAPPA